MRLHMGKGKSAIFDSASDLEAVVFLGAKRHSLG